MTFVAEDMCHVDKPDLSVRAPARLWSLDVLRGLCAGIVFLSHWHLWSDFPPEGPIEQFIRKTGDIIHEVFTVLTWPTGGHHPAVLGFFVLSGFCIHYPFERRALSGAAEADWPDYFRRRFRRIVPVYWTACTLGLAFVFAQTFRPAPKPLLALHATGSLDDIVVRFLGLAGIYPREIFAGNYILSTVTVEIFMYAAYPVFHRHAVRGRWISLGLTFLAFHLLAIALLKFFTPYWVFNSVFMLGIFWYLGALGAHLYLTRRDRVSRLGVLLAWAIFLALKATPHFPGLNLLKQAAWGLVCALGILWVVRVEQRHPALIRHRVVSAFQRLGDFSYSLYAMHTPALMLATWALLQVGWQIYPVQLIATMVAALLATFITHRAIERAFYRPRRDLISAPDLSQPSRSSMRAVLP